MSPLTECPKCGGPVQRQIGGGAGFLFKGSGFYQTDYRSNSYKEGAKADSKPAKSDAPAAAPSTPAPAKSAD